MSEQEIKPTEAIKTAFASLNSLESVQVIEELQWHDGRKWWFIKCRLTIQSADTSLVPNKTDWYVSLQNMYPRGEIELIPAKENSITKTFLHQYYNSNGIEEEPWRRGIICAKTAMSWLKRTGYDIEPFEPEKRLRWHLEQALKWLKDAASENLAINGELFELPDYNSCNKPYSVVFCESDKTFAIWKPLLNRTGIVELGPLKKPEGTLIPLSFKDHKNQLIYQPPWNDYIKNLVVTPNIIGAWALVPQVIVFSPWQAPMTWGELKNAFDNQRVNYNRMIARTVRFLRDGKQHFLLLGFPLSTKIGEPPKQIWPAPFFSTSCYESISHVFSLS